MEKHGRACPKPSRERGIEPTNKVNEWEPMVASAGPRHAAEIPELETMKQLLSKNNLLENNLSDE